MLRKKPPYPSYAVREDIRKLDQRIEQAEFIFQHHVEDRGQLVSLRQQAEDEIAVLLKQRQKLYRYEPDSPQISAITEKLRQLRHTAKLCRNIETHSVEMEPVSYTHLDVYKRQDGGGGYLWHRRHLRR